MVVRFYVAKLNDNDCERVADYIGEGMSALEAFDLVAKKNRNNPKLIKGYETRNDKWFWIFKLLDAELNSNNSTQAC